MSIDACASMVAQGDPDRFAAAMCAPMPVRADLMVLYAFNIEVSRAPWMTQEEMIAEMRLQWWKDAVAEVFEDKTVRKHEVVTPLAAMIKRAPASFPRSLFDEIIEARRFDIYREGHKDRGAFDHYVKATSGNVMELAGRALGASNLEPLQSFGWSTGLAKLMGALPDLYAHGRDPIPAGQIDRNALIEGRVSEDLSKVIKSLAEDGLEKVKTLSGVAQPKAIRPAYLVGWDTKRVLNKVRQQPHSVLTDDFTVSNARRALKLFYYSTAPVRFTG